MVWETNRLTDRHCSYCSEKTILLCVNEIIFQEQYFNLALLSILECLIPTPWPFFFLKRRCRPAGWEWNSMLAQNHILCQFRWQSLRARETSGERKSSIPRQMVFGVTESSNFDYTSKNEIANSPSDAYELSFCLLGLSAAAREIWHTQTAAGRIESNGPHAAQPHYCRTGLCLHRHMNSEHVSWLLLINALKKRKVLQNWCEKLCSVKWLSS